jgi:hypothetical protein
MEHVVGIFRSTSDVERVVQQLKLSGIDQDKIAVLRPGESARKVEATVPTTDTESEGMGEALGGTVGGAIGAASGATLGAAAASLFIPGVGPVLAAGALGAALFGAGGALAGVAAGHALEEGLAPGLPHDELFIYEDALRKGRSVVIVFSDDAEAADKARKSLLQAGAESLDAAHENWWLGLRPAAQERYESAGGNFNRDELSYRRGFEAAVHPQVRGKSFDQAMTFLTRRDPNCATDAAFRAGYDSGQAYLQNWQEKIKPEDAKAASGKFD